MYLPNPRGEVSALLVDRLREPPGALAIPCGAWASNGPATSDEDLQLTLFICYQLHHTGFDEVHDGWEWQPSLIALRTQAESRFEKSLRGLVARTAPPTTSDDVASALFELTGGDGGPSLARYVQSQATDEEFRELVVHRSIYHLREADAHTWGIPRLRGRPKAALIEIQVDEYGGGRFGHMHSELFRRAMSALGMRGGYGAYVDDVPAITLATNNLMSMFGLHRRHLGALLGHLAALEMTSSLPSQRMSAGAGRLGYGPEITTFYDVHVEADAVHEQIAAHDLCAAFCHMHPEAEPAVLFGAAAYLVLEREFTEHLLDCWRRSMSSLLPARPINAGAASASVGS